jgi:hypothetical protein
MIFYNAQRQGFTAGEPALPTFHGNCCFEGMALLVIEWIFANRRFHVHDCSVPGLL